MGSSTPQDEATVLRLPNLPALCDGFTIRLNPHYVRAATDTRQWLVSHNALGPDTLALFTAADMERLAARCYPSAPYHEFRTVCDFLCLLIVIDELSDTQTGAEARKMGASFTEALRDPSCEDGTTISAMTVELRARFGEWVQTAAFARFVDQCDEYVAATAREAELREHGEVLGLTEYQALRRENSAIRPCLSIMEFSLGLSLPDHVYDNEQFSSLYWAVGDMVCWANDLYSYRTEHSAGLAGSNYMTVLMKEKNFSLQHAGDYVGDHFKYLADRYSCTLNALRNETFGDPRLDQDVQHLTAEMANWVIGNIIWSFECRRYFGDESEEVKRTQRVTMGRAPQAVTRRQGRN